MWLDKLKELKKRSGMSVPQIAKGTCLTRIFNCETSAPTITTIIPIVKFLGGSLSEIFADTQAVVGDQNLATLQADIDVVTAERDALVAENKILAEKVAVLTEEIELLNIKLMYTEKILATHDYYNKITANK